MSTKTALIRGEILSGHKGAAIEVPFDPTTKWKTPAVSLWTGRRGHRVGCSLKKLAFESAIVGRSKRFWLLVSDDVLAQAGVTVGDTISVNVRPLPAGVDPELTSAPPPTKSVSARAGGRRAPPRRR